MDWVIEAGDRAAVRVVRSQIGDYLRRHGDPGTDVGGAELAVSELLTNVISHTPGPMWVTLIWPGAHPDLRVIDLGEGFDLTTELPEDPESTGGRGLFIVGRLVLRLEARRRRLGGNEVIVSLPVTRSSGVIAGPPRRRIGALPALADADPERGFPPDAFLRALVVSLVEAVSFQHGPDAVEALIAQAASDVGGQLEAEFRQATGSTGRLTPPELGRCFERMRRAIDGDFEVIETTDDEVVLESTRGARCPFGGFEQRAPALCRMTSAVIGGIAARNADHGAEVALEERIVSGDVGCRVSIRLDPPGETPTWANRYLSPV